MAADAGSAGRRHHHTRAAWRRGALLLLAFACGGFVSTVRPTAAGARQLIAAPPSLTNEASAPCAFYSCAADPAPHVKWERSLASLPGNYCAIYTCKPMDLVPDHGFDDNLFPLNPDWGYRVEEGTAPDAEQLCGNFDAPLSCTSRVVEYDGPGVDTAAYFLCPLLRAPRLGSFHGHVNWEPATYEGALSWDSHSSSFADDDYSINLSTPGAAGATVARPEGVHLEFDSDETIDRFGSSHWWHEFHSRVDEGDAHAARFIDGDHAVVTGLIGLDTVHSVSAESHPVYAMAIETNRKSALAGATDKWALFARNWGNEGYCSQHNHSLAPGPLSIRIPWLAGATGVLGVLPKTATQVALTGHDLDSENTDGHTAVALHVLPYEGVVLTFDLSTPAAQEPMYWGTVELKWTFGASPAAPSSPHTAVAGVNASRAVSDGGETSDVEPIAERLFRRLPRALRLRALALLHRRLGRPRARALAVRIAMGAPLVAPLRALGESVAAPLSRGFVALGRAQRATLCGAYRGHVPGYPAMCRTFARRPPPSARTGHSGSY